MARGKKKAADLTPEEKLKQALVPVEEQPYKVPENWCWTRIGYLSTIHRGVSYKKNDAHSNKGQNDCLIMRGGNIGEGYITTDADNVYIDKSLVNEEQLIQKNDIVIVASTGSTKVIGRAGIADISYSDVAFGAFLMLVRPKQWANQQFVDYYFQSDNYRNRIRSLASGVNINNIRADYITETPIPLAPLPEQKRIVDRIESFFTKLDEAKEKAQEVIDGFELRKSAILHQAFSGELTANWRAEHGMGLDSWETRSLSSDFDIVGGIQKKPSRTPKNNPIPYLTVANVFRDRIDITDVRYFEVFDGELEKLQLKEKDILIVEGNGSGNEIGRSAIWRNELPVCIHQNHIIRARRKNNRVLPEYILLFLNSATGKAIMKEKAKTTAGLFNLSTGKIRTITVPYANVDEQTEIVRILDTLLTKEAAAKAAAEAVLDQIDTMKKAVLARAFRGELGTNVPEEESAVELLKSVL